MTFSKFTTHMIHDTIYITGITDAGTPLIGGLWRLYRQEGFPLDLSLLIVREKGCAPDIAELFAEATIHSELPQVHKQASELFTTETQNMWLRMVATNSGDQFLAAEQLLLSKREHGQPPSEYGRALLAASALREKARQ